ncbi:hypothetical protein H8N01_01440 [Streptomyces sp. AC536]|uniref:hypothetical protein n=1 Tax=Streptomyces buecherae TaxID=2763006 RepID=UPI00164D904D|nr:hypothetical protein [Streptomyces buecherae]MBC3981271.1 hypothetical protein [Streptomyces buecherae]QNJ41314.1 hypothetical protein H7H31_17005 [Streptomyces buecherae]
MAELLVPAGVAATTFALILRVKFYVLLRDGLSLAGLLFVLVLAASALTHG